MAPYFRFLPFFILLLLFLFFVLPRVLKADAVRRAVPFLPILGIFAALISLIGDQNSQKRPPESLSGRDESTLVGINKVTGTDEEQIRKLFDDFIIATTQGVQDLALNHIADSAIFLVPGIGEMDKISFVQAAAGESPEQSQMIFELDSKIREIQVMGSYAYLWSESTLHITPRSGGATTTWASHSLSIMEKLDGRWQIIREANTIVSDPR
jgi:ketosteroid isomerase-like protein